MRKYIPSIFFIVSHLLLSIFASDQSRVTSLLKKLLTGPLKGDTLLIINDSNNLNLEALSNTGSPVILASPTQFDPNMYQRQLISGVDFTTVWIPDDNGTTLDEIIGEPTIWCPQYLIIINNNSSISNAFLLNQETSLRAENVVLFRLFDSHYRIKMFTNMPFLKSKLVSIGYWNSKTLTSKKSLFLDWFKSFEGANLRLASYCNDFPFLYSSGDLCTGCNIDALKLIGDHLNFTYDVQDTPADSNWGAIENGTWTGMLADLAYNEMHLIINYFLVNHERWAAFDSTYPYHAEGFGFLAHLPKPLPKWKSLLHPFTWNTWVSVVLCMLVVTASFAFLCSVESSAAASDNLTLTAMSVSGIQLFFNHSLPTFPVLWELNA